MRELRRSQDKKILGVAGGFAEYFDMDKTVWRALWVFVCVVMPPAILAYFILGIVMPSAPANRYQAPPAPPEPEVVVVPPVYTEQPNTQYEQPHTTYEQPRREEPVYTRDSYKQLTKSRDKWLSGVCGGVADYFGVDPVIVRALWLGAVFLAGTGLLLYIVLAILMPEPHRQMPPR
ncbi:MAG TPA: PspC domain-containing protein [Symbiobacteriaceae bacterium]|nr:PspC domain-containing protein [Symbiobacteriaceae bacterium]